MASSIGMRCKVASQTLGNLTLRLGSVRLLFCDFPYSPFTHCTSSTVTFGSPSKSGVTSAR